MKNNILIYEPFASGHHREYILHLLDFLQDGNNSIYDTIHFFLHPNFKKELNNKYTKLPVQFIWKKENEPFKEIIKYIKQHEINHFYFMYLDTELAHAYHINLLNKHNIHIQGLYFRPYIRMYESQGTLLKKLNYFRIRLFQKYHLYKNAPKMQSIMVLNDLDAVNRFGKEKPKGRFSFICDPMDTYKLNDGNQMRRSLGIEEDSPVILSFGSQDKRKNTLSLVKAMDKVAQVYKKPLVLCVVGVIHEVAYEKKIITEANRLNKKYDHLRIIVFNEYADKDDFFNIANVVAIPYINFFFSSGIFISAIHYGKSILGSNIGLIQSLIDKYHLGKTINPYSEDSISEGLLYLITNKIPQENFNKYLEDNVHSRDEFANTILNYIPSSIR